MPLRRSPLFLLSLVAMSAVGGMATHIYLPAMPAVQQDFGAETGTVQLTLSLSMIMLGIMPLIYGPLSDQYGRRPILLIGTLIFLAGCLVCAFSTTLWQLILGRMLQAAGAAAGYSLSRTVTRDVYGQDDTARMLAYLMMAVVVAPMLAPGIGGILTDAFDWRAIFIFMSGMVCLVFLLFFIGLPETHPNRTGGGFRQMFRGMAMVMRVPQFWGFAMQAALGMSVFYAFLAAAPYLMTDVMGRPAREYGLLFLGLSLTFIFGNFISARLVPRFGPVRLILIGVVCAALTLIASAVLFWTTPLTPLILFTPATVVSLFLGLILANAQAKAIETHPDAIGAAAGLSSFLQLATAAAATQIVGVFSDGTVWPMMTVMAVATTMALLMTPLIRRELPVLKQEK